MRASDRMPGVCARLTALSLQAGPLLCPRILARLQLGT